MSDDLKKAEKLIRDVLKKDFAKTDAAGRLALLGKLLQQADENKADAALEYICLYDAREEAVLAGDSPKAAEIQARLRDAFKTDFATMLLDLKKLEASAKTADSASVLAALLARESELALAAGDYDYAVRFNSRAEDLLPLSKDAALKARLKGEIPRVQMIKRESVAALAAQKTLATKADDPDANLVAGRFALLLGDVDTGMTLLAKSKGDVLGALAKRELAPPQDAQEQTSLADGWFERAEKEPLAALKIRMQERAALWYASALPGLTGIVKLKVEERMKALPAVAKTENNVTSVPKSASLVGGAGKTVNLLRLVDPTLDALAGKWELKENGLQSDSKSPAKLQFPYCPPDEYDFKICFARLEGHDLVAQVMPIGGRSSMWAMAGNRNKHHALMGVLEDIKRGLENGKKYTSIVQVRKSEVRVFLDGEMIVQASRFDKSSVSAKFGMKVNTAVGIGTFESPTLFYSAEILEISGPGKYLRGAANTGTPETKKPAVAAPVTPAGGKEWSLFVMNGDVGRRVAVYLNGVKTGGDGQRFHKQGYSFVLTMTGTETVVVETSDKKNGALSFLLVDPDGKTVAYSHVGVSVRAPGGDQDKFLAGDTTGAEKAKEIGPARVSAMQKLDHYPTALPEGYVEVWLDSTPGGAILAHVFPPEPTK